MVEVLILLDSFKNKAKSRNAPEKASKKSVLLNVRSHGNRLLLVRQAGSKNGYKG